MKPETIQRALSAATTEQIKSEWAKRTQALRKIKTGGRNGGRPKRKLLDAPAPGHPVPAGRV